jgi:regulator of nonsense transcripts 1
LFDEAAHAREPCTLIPLALFPNAEAWICSGDPRQISPFVNSSSDKRPSRAGCEDSMAHQLKVSMMERAEARGAIRHRMFLNHRGRNGLHQIPPSLWYGACMESTIPLEDRYPEWGRPLLAGLAGLRDPKDRNVMASGLMVRSKAECVDETGQGARHHPQNRRYVEKRIRELVRLRGFVQADGKTPGTIMIITPYRFAFSQYRSMAKGLGLGGRVDVRTIGTAHGTEADVVFADLVSDNPRAQLNNKQTLCAASTRAMQAEIILVPGKSGAEPEGAPDHLWRLCRAHHKAGLVVQI